MKHIIETEKPIVDEHYIRPRNAERLMKNAHNAMQCVYVCGANGFGKTSFVCSMLSRRRFHYFSASESENLLNGMDAVIHSEKRPKETIVVIDDLHRMEDDNEKETLVKLLQESLSMEDVWVVLISRAEVPSWLKALYIQSIFIIINEKSLALSEKEVGDFLTSWDITYSENAMNKIAETLQGYPLAIRIFAMHILAQGNKAIPGPEAIAEAARKGYNDLYDYYDTHVFDHWNRELQEFLMDLSILDEFDLEIAQMLTRRNDVESMLRRATEMGSFIISRIEGERIVYELRQLMHEGIKRRLLLKKSKTYVDNLYYNAGMYYEMKGDVVNALNMYEKGNHKESISGLLIQNARNHPGSGYYWQLRHYYMDLPEEIIRTSPELMAGMSLLQSICMNDEESERWYQELVSFEKTQTGTMRKDAKARLVYLDIALPQRGSGNVLDTLKQVSFLIKERDTIFPEFSVTNNQPSVMAGGKDFCEWSKKDTQIAKTMGKVIDFAFGNFGKGLTNLALAESYFEKGKDYYEVSVLADRGRMQAESGGKLEQVFVGVALIAQMEVLNHRLEDAMEMLDSLKKTAAKEAPHILPGIEALKIRFHLCDGQLKEPMDWMETAPNEDEEFCTLERYYYMTKVRVYLSLGKKEKALSLLNRMLIFAESRERTFLWIEAKILYAITEYRMGLDEWVDSFQEAITKAEEYHFVRIFVREGAAILPLLKDQRLVWKSQKFMTQILKDCSQQAKYYPNYLKERPAEVNLSEMSTTILRMQADGYKNEQIAKALETSMANVKYHNTETYKKLGVKSKAAAVIEARKRGLI